VEVLEDRPAEIHTPARAGETGMAVGVVDLALLRVAEDTISFRAFAKFGFRFGFIFRMAVRVPLQRALAVRGLDFVDEAARVTPSTS
jgi:hypothetical protein